MLSRRSLGVPSRKDKPPDIWDTHGKSGNVFVNPPASSSPYPGGFNPWIPNVREDTLPHVTSERQNSDTALHGRFRIFILTNSLTQQRSLVGRWDSKLRYALVHNFPRMLSYGSKKCTWLILWMISNLRVLSQELLGQTLSCSMRELLQHWTESSRCPLQEKGQSGGNESSKRRPLPPRRTDRSLTWSTSTSGSLGPMILSRIMRTYSQLFFEKMIFRNSVGIGTKFYCLWRKSHLMTFWKACTN